MKSRRLMGLTPRVQFVQQAAAQNSFCRQDKGYLDAIRRFIARHIRSFYEQITSVQGEAARAPIRAVLNALKPTQRQVPHRHRPETAAPFVQEIESQDRRWPGDIARHG